MQNYLISEAIGDIAGCAYKKMPDVLIYQAMKKLPDWMVDVSEGFDNRVNGIE